MAPPIFRQLTYEQARDAAATEKKWLLIDFSAEWCQPCKHMDRTTWLAPEVISWVKEHAVAIQLDGDHSPLAQEWAVQAYPTLILFHGEKELDRSSGARNAEALLKWLNGVKSGRTELDEFRAIPKEDLQGQLQLASMLVDRKLDAEALDVFAWLWEHSLGINEDFVGVRSSFLIQALEPLLERSEAARQRFAKFRDTAKERGGVALSDFVVLNQALGETEKTLAWLRTTTAAEAQELRLHRDPSIREVIAESGEYKLFATLINDPLAALNEEEDLLNEIRKSMPDNLPPEMVEHALSAMEANRDAFAELLISALRAADRKDEARQVEARLIELKG